MAKYKPIGVTVTLQIVRRDTDGKLFINHPTRRLVEVADEHYTVRASKFGGYYLTPVETPEVK